MLGNITDVTKTVDKYNKTKETMVRKIGYLGDIDELDIIVFDDIDYLIVDGVVEFNEIDGKYFDAIDNKIKQKEDYIYFIATKFDMYGLEHRYIYVFRKYNFQ